MAQEMRDDVMEQIQVRTTSVVVTFSVQQIVKVSIILLYAQDFRFL